MNEFPSEAAELIADNVSGQIFTNSTRGLLPKGFPFNLRARVVVVVVFVALMVTVVVLVVLLVAVVVLMVVIVAVVVSVALLVAVVAVIALMVLLMRIVMVLMLVVKTNTQSNTGLCWWC